MSKVVGIFVKFWHFFTMPAHQIWPCHVTQKANFENFLCFPNSAFNIRKSNKTSSRKALYFRSYQLKTSWGSKPPPPPPSAFRVKCTQVPEIKLSVLLFKQYSYQSQKNGVYKAFVPVVCI